MDRMANRRRRLGPPAARRSSRIGGSGRPPKESIRQSTTRSSPDAPQPFTGCRRGTASRLHSRWSSPGARGTVAAWQREELSLGRRQDGACLGLLLLNAGLVVSADHLVDQLWPEGPPTSGRRLFRHYVARVARPARAVRRSIVAQGAGCSIRSIAIKSTYTASRANQRARDIADPLVRAEALTSALGLWRGPVLAGVADDDLSGRLSTGLEETRWPPW